MSQKSKSIPVTAFRPGEGFLPRYQRLIQEVVIPYQRDILEDRMPGVEKSHGIENFRQAAKVLKGETPDEAFYGMVFQDSDVAKWLEAAAYSLAVNPNGEMEQEIDDMVDLLAGAQHEDGYLNTYFTVKSPERRWTNFQEAHELYCAGHLMEAATAYYAVTGKDKFLKIMEKTADCIYEQVVKSKPRAYSGHPEIELALMKLYRASGNEKYKEMALHFVNVRGQKPFYFQEEKDSRGWVLWGGVGSDALDTDYTQSTLPVREQRDAVGHAVRAVYLYTAMADLAAETGDEGLKTACDALWDSIVHRRMYLTGAIGSTVIGEAFTVDYDLPNDTVYAETCASIGLIFFARKMLELDAKGEYADVMERALYNTVLAGMQLDGKQFYYVNPLEVVPGISGEAATQKHDLPQRPKWYACACCPPNVARLLSSLGEYAYTESETTLYAHLYLGGAVETKLFSLRCETGYPRDGRVLFTVDRDTAANLALHIPGWSAEKTGLLRNGEPVKLESNLENGYAVLAGPFQKGDTVELSLDMTPKKMYASSRIPADTGKVAVQRGPLVYCAEGVDNENDVLSLSLKENGAVVEAPEHPLPAGALALEAEGWRMEESRELYSAECPKKRTVKVMLSPYYVWGNRGLEEMRVWLPES